MKKKMNGTFLCRSSRLFNRKFRWNFLHHFIQPLQISPDYAAYLHPVPLQRIHNIPSAAAESLQAMPQNAHLSSECKPQNQQYPQCCNCHKFVSPIRYAPRLLHSTMLLIVFSYNSGCVSTPITSVPSSIREMVPCLSSPAAYASE